MTKKQAVESGAFEKSQDLGLGASQEAEVGGAKDSLLSSSEADVRWVSEPQGLLLFIPEGQVMPQMRAASESQLFPASQTSLLNKSFK